MIIDRDQIRVPVGLRGWALVIQLERDLLLADFWSQRSSSLALDERQRIAHGDYTPLWRPEPPSWSAGEWLKVAANLWIVPHPARARKAPGRGYSISFDRVRDFRARFLRRVPQMFDPPKLDERGFSIPPTATAIEAARLDGNYTSSRMLAIPERRREEAEAVPDDYQNVLGMNARQRQAEHEKSERAVDLAKRDLRSITAQIRETAVEMARMGIDPNPWLVDLQRQINERRDEREAA